MSSGINYLSDALDTRKIREDALRRMAQGTVSPYARRSDPSGLCGVPDPFAGGVGCPAVRGYRYEGHTGTAGKGGFNLADFGKELLTGFVAGGLSSAAFYGAGKAVEAVKGSVRGVGKGGLEPDFYVGPNGKALASQYKDWIGTNIQKELLDQAENPQLQNAIKQLYRRNSFIGDGGTADIIRFEQQTGLMLGKNGGSHVQKGIDMAKYIENKILTQDLSPLDRALVAQLLEDLYNALGR